MTKGTVQLVAANNPKFLLQGWNLFLSLEDIDVFVENARINVVCIGNSATVNRFTGPGLIIYK